MKKLNKLTLNVNDINQSNILKKNEMKQIVGGYGYCYVFDVEYNRLYQGACYSGNCTASCYEQYSHWNYDCICNS